MNRGIRLDGARLRAGSCHQASERGQPFMHSRSPRPKLEDKVTGSHGQHCVSETSTNVRGCRHWQQHVYCRRKARYDYNLANRRPFRAFRMKKKYSSKKSSHPATAPRTAGVGYVSQSSPQSMSMRIENIQAPATAPSAAFWIWRCRPWGKLKAIDDG